MQGEQTEKRSLQMLIGEQLSAVTFVQDYLQLHFDSPRLTVFSHAVVMHGARLRKHELLTVIPLPSDLQMAR
jgi:hypothetical protein